MSQLDEVLQGMVTEIVKKTLEETQIEKVFNATEAAKYLRVSRSWLYQNMSELPFADVGGYKFLKSDLDNYIKEKAKKGPVHISEYKGTGRDYKIV